MIGKLTLVPCVSLMSGIHPLCDSSGSTLMAMTLALRLSNSLFSLATAPSSVVHTGVKSLGWENRMPQLSPSHSWNLMVPSVVSAVKSGASSPSCNAMRNLLWSLSSYLHQATPEAPQSRPVLSDFGVADRIDGPGGRRL